MVWIYSKLTKDKNSINRPDHPPPLWFLQKSILTYDILIIYLFPENFIEIRQDVKNILKFYSSILTIFANFFYLFWFPCYKNTSDISILFI